jgi:tetratricopeptide (TPR) repeat protein
MLPLALAVLLAIGDGTLLQFWRMPKSPVIIQPIAKDSELWRLMQAAEVAEREHDHQRVIDLYTAALKIEPGPNIIARDLHAGRGSAYNYLNMPNEAYADYDAALNDGYVITMNRKTALWHMGRGYAALQLEKYQRAKDDFDIVLKELPPTSRVLDWRGAAYQGLGNRERAIADYKAALALNPDNAYARDGLKDLENP